jgi:hypothetical protein
MAGPLVSSVLKRSVGKGAQFDADGLDSMHG